MESTNRPRARARRVIASLLLAAVAALASAVSANAEGSFVIGDQNAAVGSQVTFWGAQWWKLNSLTEGPAPAAFKGFADNVTLSGTCGGSWTTDPGNSSEPPAGPLPGTIEVLVSSNISKSGKVISGDIAGIALVATEPGYAANPGHAGTGTVIRTVCRAGEGGGGGGGGIH